MPGSVRARLSSSANCGVARLVGVTSRTPNFGREDVAERLLPLKLGRLNSFRPENELLAEVQERRIDLMAAIICDVYKAVVELQKARNERHQLQVRLADFADFALKVGASMDVGR